MPSSASISIRDFIAEHDAGWLHGLWHRTLHERWAISLPAMLSVLWSATLLYVAEIDGRRSGFCAVDARTGRSAGLLLMLVEPEMQRCGIGSRLYTMLENEAISRPMQQVVLGGGKRRIFLAWYSIRTGQCVPFFARRGFEEQDRSADLVQELGTFDVPDWVKARQRASGTTLHLASPERAADLLAFEEEHFPAWAGFYRNEITQGTYGDILFAQSAPGEITGTILMRSDAASPWLQHAGRRIGTLNTLGVSPANEGQGNGLALTAGAMVSLQQRGCSSCYIQWTGLIEWYGKLGAKPWAYYRMASKTL